MEQSQHQMVLVQSHESGADEWLCPECGRRFLLQYPPNYKMLVLVRGDEYASHSGGKGGIEMAAARIIAAEASAASEMSRDEPGCDAGEIEPDVELDDEALRPWKRFFESSE
jgi:hypothetical protein